MFRKLACIMLVEQLNKASQTFSHMYSTHSSDLHIGVDNGQSTIGKVGYFLNR
jgi:hypothetical protein